MFLAGYAAVEPLFAVLGLLTSPARSYFQEVSAPAGASAAEKSALFSGTARRVYKLS